MTVRTRVAPSPTGDPHVGTAYMALFNWAFARSQGGQFILRIEDTDAARSTAASEQAILDALKWLGIDWDEGPGVDGPHAPYRQSERRDRYQAAADQLINTGKAFRCFCTPERLNALRAEQQARGETTRYDGLCRSLDPAAATERVAAGESHVVRMVVPDEGSCRFQDLLRGEIEIPWSQIDMQVLLKSDGMPTYHLAVVVDDDAMGITHIIRGEEWINSTPKHVALYEYFGWQLPVFCHMPLLRNPDSSKLSKRKNPTSLNYYRNVGILPEALRNYLALMGWSMPDESEIFSLATFVEAFELERIHLGGPVFDLEKLGWLNGQYLRELAPDAFQERLRNWLLEGDRLQRLIPLIQPRTERFADIAPQVEYLLGDRRPLTAEDFTHKAVDADTAKKILDHVLRVMDALRSWQRDELYELCNGLANAMGIKFRDFLFPLFIALSGRAVSLPLFDSMEFLGQDITRVRLREGVQALGGIGKKQEKRLEKDFRSLAFDPANPSGKATES